MGKILNFNMNIYIYSVMLQVQVGDSEGGEGGGEGVEVSSSGGGGGESLKQLLQISLQTCCLHSTGMDTSPRMPPLSCHHTRMHPLSQHY